MLNLITLDISDRPLLENSYNALKHKEDVEIVIDNVEKEQIFSQTIENIKIPNNTSFAFQNLFKIKTTVGYFYIAQCLVDFGYPLGNYGSQTFEHKYSFQIIGIANITIDIGVTHLRPQTKLDKIINRFFNNDIDFSGVEKLNDNYFLLSNKKTELTKCFDKNFLNTIAKYEDVLLTIKGKQIYLSFDQELVNNQTRIAQDILANFKYLANN